MKSTKQRIFSCCFFASLAAQGCGRMDTDGAVVVGALHPITISSGDIESTIKPMEYSLKDSTQAFQAKSYILHHHGRASDNSEASYIALHFSEFDIDPSCQVEISDGDGTTDISTIYKGKGRNSMRRFWARHIYCSSLKLTLKCDGENNNGMSRSTFVVDEYVAGFQMNATTGLLAEPTIAPTEGPTQSPTNGPTSAPTYAPTEDPTSTPTSEPTLSLSSPPTTGGTPSSVRNSAVRSPTPGTRSSSLFAINVKEVTPPNQDNHKTGPSNRKLSVCGAQDSRQPLACIQSSQADVYQRSLAVARLLISGRYVCSGFLVSDDVLVTAASCLGTEEQALDADYEFQYQRASCSSSEEIQNMEIFEAQSILEYNPTSDYAIIQLAGSPGSKYGYLNLSDTRPAPNEPVYIPQHRMGFDRQVSISETCTVVSNGLGKDDKTCPFGGSFKDLRHGCDTDGGAIGSPVIARQTGLVVGMHHCSGDCDSNYAIPATEIHNSLRKLLPQRQSNEMSLLSSEQSRPQTISSKGHTCLMSTNTDQCSTLLAQSVGSETEPCECANFCGGEFLSCCKPGEACPITCTGKLVAGCSSLHSGGEPNWDVRSNANIENSEPWFVVNEATVDTNGSQPSSNIHTSTNSETTSNGHHRLRRKR